MRQSTVERCEKVNELVRSGMPIYKARKKIGVGTATWIKWGMTKSELKRQASLKSLESTPLVLPDGNDGLARRVIASNLTAQDKLSILSSVID